MKRFDDGAGAWLAVRTIRCTLELTGPAIAHDHRLADVAGHLVAWEEGVLDDAEGEGGGAADSSQTPCETGAGHRSSMDDDIVFGLEFEVGNVKIADGVQGSGNRALALGAGPRGAEFALNLS